MNHDSLTADHLRSVLSYDEDTGVFVWSNHPSHSHLNGRRAGSDMQIGYTTIRICGRARYAHRLAWLYVTGEWPDAQIDHRNGIRNDNRFSNLRQATKAENMQNIAVRTDSLVGLPGVSKRRRRDRWSARITVDGKRHNLGDFESPEDAFAAYAAAKANLHPFSPAPREVS